MKQSSRPIAISQTAPNTLVDLLRSRTEQYPNRLAYRFIQDGDARVNSITCWKLDHQAQALEAYGARDHIASFPCDDYLS